MSAAKHRIFLISGEDGAGLLDAFAGVPEAGVSLAGGREEMTELGQPHVVVLDVDHAGSDFLRWMRDHPAHRNTPVIALTGRRDPPAIERLYGLGVNACLLKPLNPLTICEIAEGIGTYAALVPRRASSRQ